jgi:hypothetical protein
MGAVVDVEVARLGAGLVVLMIRGRADTPAGASARR